MKVTKLHSARRTIEMVQHIHSRLYGDAQRAKKKLDLKVHIEAGGKCGNCDHFTPPAFGTKGWCKGKDRWREKYCICEFHKFKEHDNVSNNSGN